MADVRLTKLKKSYGPLEVVHGVDVEISNGEFVVLVGPSGCGKSTILRMIAGLESITSGEIAIDGQIVNGLPPRARDVAMVFQNYALYPHLTVAENMGFPLRMRGLPRAEIATSVARAARIIGLEALLDRYPRQLSGGQRQRVAMGRAIVRNPRVFLFDEPLSNLDAKLRVQMRAQIRELHQTLGTTTIYVTHDQVEAMTMADKIVTLKDGSVEQIGSPLELYDRPTNVFVAGFIGSPAMNLLEGIVAGGPPARFEMMSGQRLNLPDGVVAEDGTLVHYGIRPEHFTIVGPGEDGTIDATVAVVEPTGVETLIVARAGAIELVASFRDRVPVKVGEAIGLRPMVDRAHLFDRRPSSSGARL